MGLFFESKNFGIDIPDGLTVKIYSTEQQDMSNYYRCISIIEFIKLIIFKFVKQEWYATFYVFKYHDKYLVGTTECSGCINGCRDRNKRCVFYEQGE